MRPTATQPSYLLEPFNQLFGTRTNVRVLRVLSQTEAPLSRAAVARRAELNASGVRRSIDSLIQLGIIEPVGSRVQTVRLRREHRLASPILALFDAETSQYAALVDMLRSVAHEVIPFPMAAWVDGIEAYDSLEVPQLTISVLIRTDDADRARDQLIGALQEKFSMSDVKVRPRVLTRADLAALGDEAFSSDALPLMGPHPSEWFDENGRGTIVSHAHHDLRQQRIGSVIADWLLDDTELVERTLHDLRRRTPSDAPSHDPRVEWLAILEKGPSHVRRILLDPGEEGTRLRQSLPFAPVLSRVERDHMKRHLQG